MTRSEQEDGKNKDEEKEEEEEEMTEEYAKDYVYKRMQSKQRQTLGLLQG